MTQLAVSDHAAILELATFLSSLRTFVTADGLLSNGGGLKVHATTTKFTTTTAPAIRINGASVDLFVSDYMFSAAHVISAGKFGAILVQADSDDVISTKVVGSPQAYNTAALAIAALPAADANNIALGYIVLEANGGGAWTANTDDLVAGSDCASISFVDATPLSAPTFPPALQNVIDARAN